MSTELSAIRAKMRAVNVEYSALVRAQPTQEQLARMDELRANRRVLMALMLGKLGQPSQQHKVSLLQHAK
jgi:hypothetical protein